MSPNDDRILVLAPTGQDAALICEQLQAAGLCGLVCRDLGEFAAAVLEGTATGLIAEEALDESGVHRLIEALSAQPAWSDLPITILTNGEIHSGPRNSELTRKLADAGNVTLVERPSRVVTLLMTIQAAVRARRRQYEFREYLQQYERYQEQVRQTQKLESLGVLAGGIAHDFNNILTGILGNASLAADLLPPDHPVRRLVEDVVTASERAAGLTSQMLAYAGKGQFVIRPVDLSAVVRGLEDFFRASIPKRVQLSLNLAAGLPPVAADVSQLEQVIMNLVINAAEAIPDGRAGKLSVATRFQSLDREPSAAGFRGAVPQPGVYAVLEISDDGVGMDEDTQAKVFDPFFTTKFLGRGLGLAAVQGIVRGHNGSLMLESAPGKGTTFSIWFPACESGCFADGHPEQHQSGSQSATILVVDDEEIVRRTAASLLQQNGYSVVSAENGRSAVEIFRKLSDRIDVVLLDMTMPVMDGEETLRALKAIRPDANVILSSGYNEAEAVRRFAGGGLAGFIQKPYTSSRLVEKIKRTLENARIHA